MLNFKLISLQKEYLKSKEDKNMADEIKKIGTAFKEGNESDSEYSVLCPLCRTANLHPVKIGVAYDGDVTELGLPSTLGSELTHRARSKVITVFECEQCTGDKPEIIRIEVNHKGELKSGIYYVTGKINYNESKWIPADGTD